MKLPLTRLEPGTHGSAAKELSLENIRNLK